MGQCPLHWLAFMDNKHIASTYRSFAAGDRISMEFRTTALNGLIFHGEDNQKRHELSAWIHNGEVRLRLIGHCHWLYLRDLAYDSYNVSDGRFHRVSSSNNFSTPKESLHR